MLCAPGGTRVQTKVAGSGHRLPLVIMSNKEDGECVEARPPAAVVRVAGMDAGAGRLPMAMIQSCRKTAPIAPVSREGNWSLGSFSPLSGAGGLGSYPTPFP